MINIVTSSSCPYCSMAKNLITSLWFKYNEKVLEMGSPELMTIVRSTGLMTVPQIFAWEISKEKLLGWYSEIEALHNEWKLEEILKKAS